MAETTTLPTVPPFPDDLIASVTAEAEHSALAVHEFLEEQGVPATPENPTRLPAMMLLNLGAALRLRTWENSGLRVHLEAGLPTALQAIQEILRPDVRSTRLPSDFALRVFDLLIDRFAWHGRRHLGAEVALDFLPDDAALDALAEFLWAHRHDGRPRGADNGGTT